MLLLSKLPMDTINKYFCDWTLFEKMWLFLSSVLIISLSIIWSDSTLAMLSSLAGIMSVVLCAKGKIENYAFGLFQATTYAYICFTNHIYGEVMYNLLMIPMIIIGFFTWKHYMNEKTREIKTRNLTPKGWVWLIAGSVVAIALYHGILEILGGQFTVIDSASTTLSFIATILMLARFSEQWLVWIVVNITSVVLWALALNRGSEGSLTLLIMWSAYLFNSLYGYINWRKMAKL